MTGIAIIAAATPTRQSPNRTKSASASRPSTSLYPTRNIPKAIIINPNSITILLGIFSVSKYINGLSAA
jgi:hypothetical protein